MEVVVTLRAPALAQAIAESRVLTASTKGRRLDLGSPTSVSYLRDLDRAQRRVARRIVRTIPSAHVRWRYRVVLDGLAIVLPASRLQEIGRAHV